jgi:plasmid stabilization system protein ParE
MTLPVNARVEAAPNFLSNLDAARQFFIDQDVDSTPSRLRKLKSQLLEMVSILSWSPASGHPARFMSGRSVQARLRTESVYKLAVQAGLPSLREYIVGSYVVLYAHSDVEVVLLAIKHQRQLIYSAES